MISVQGLGKEFRHYHSPADRLREALLRRPFHTVHQALEDVHFEVADGESLGVIGRNGAGKSTLLKLLNGVLLPDSGSLHCSGKVTGLLELGTGFDMAMSGSDNILTNGLLLGMDEAEISRKRAQIIAFSELGDFINAPLRTYSSGMVMRLAFSIAIHAEPAIFLVDEALSVGDGHFQQKCMHRIREFRAGGGSIIFVSHDLNAVKMLCDRVLVLQEGRVVVDDEPEVAVNYYNRLLAGDAGGDAARSYIEGGYGNFLAMIAEASVCGADSQTTAIASGEEAQLRVVLNARQALPAVTLGMMIRDRFGQDIYGTNSHLLGLPLQLEPGPARTLQLRFPVRLAPGKYTITLALHEGTDHSRHCYHWWDSVLSFEVCGVRGAPFGGLCNLEAVLEEGSPGGEVRPLPPAGAA